MNAPTTELTIIDRAALALGSSNTEKQIKEFIEQSKSITVITNKDGREECHAAAMKAVKARTSISKGGAAARADATAYSKAVIAEENRLLNLIEPEEKRLKDLRDEWDSEREAEKAEEARIESERQAKLQQAIDLIRNTPSEFASSSAADIEDEICNLEGIIIDVTFYAERTDEVAFVMAQTLKQMGVLLEGKKAQEELARQLEAKRIENERIAREQAEAQAKLEAEERHRIQVEIEAQRKANQEEAERQRVEREELALEKAKQEAEYKEARRIIEENQRIEREKIAAKQKEIDDFKAAQIAESSKMQGKEIPEQNNISESPKISANDVIKCLQDIYGITHGDACDLIISIAEELKLETER